MSIPNKLPQYPVPERLQKCLIEEKELTFYYPEIAQPLYMDNYLRRMSTLLFIEEVQMQLDILEYSYW